MADKRKTAENPPSPQELSEMVGSSLWDKTCRQVESAYRAAPRVEYSGCSMQPGWNVKYKKGGRALCTLYPMEGSFCALVVIGKKEEAHMPWLLPRLGEDTRRLYAQTPFSLGGRWLMLPVAGEQALDDLLLLVKLRWDCRI